MQWFTAAVGLFAIMAIAMAQPHQPHQPHQPYGNSYSGYDNNKHPSGPGYHQTPPHSSSKQSGYYPGSSPYGHKDQKGYGGYNPYNPYGGYNDWKYYETCYPNYDKYSTDDRYHLRYLESAPEDSLNTNSSNFQDHPPVQGPSDVKCVDGPKHILHTEKYEWHWPPIYKGTCDDLPSCKDPKCISTKTVKESTCVLVFRKYGYRWIRVGYRKITYETDKDCKCRQCKDIKSYRECVHEHPCPNEGTDNSYCYWKKPYAPPPTYYNPYTPHNPHNPHSPKNPPSPHTPHTPHDDKKDDDKKPTYDDDHRERRSIDEETVLERQARQAYGYNQYDHYGDDKKNGYSDPYDPHKQVLYAVPTGYCDCCEPTLCKPPKKFDYDLCKCVCPKKKCLPGHKFNPETCKCECPDGTYYDKEKMKCVGKCKEVNPKACENVVCKDNPHFYCKLDKKYKCVCPSCDDVDYWQRGLCKKTNCIKQKYKPYCVFDWRNGKCRCPDCYDQKTPAACEKTSCIDKYRQKYCKWVWYPYPSCQCGAPQYPPSPKHHSEPGYGTTPHDPHDDDKKPKTPSHE